MQLLDGQVKAGAVRIRRSMAEVVLLANEITTEHRLDLLAAALRVLLRIAKDRTMRSTALGQLRIFGACRVDPYKDPARPASVFPAVDKLVKATGDFHLVLDLARVSVRAAGLPLAKAKPRPSKCCETRLRL